MAIEVAEELSKGAKFLIELRQQLGLPPNACLACGQPVLDWEGEPTIPSHEVCPEEDTWQLSKKS